MSVKFLGVVIFFDDRVGLAMFGANNGMKRCGLRFWFCIECNGEDEGWPLYLGCFGND